MKSSWEVGLKANVHLGQVFEVPSYMNQILVKCHTAQTPAVPGLTAAQLSVLSQRFQDPPFEGVQAPLQEKGAEP